jgi:hypothetical protein
MGKIRTKLMLDLLVKLGYVKAFGEYEYEPTPKLLYQLASTAFNYALITRINLGFPTPSIRDVVMNTLMLAAYNDLANMKGSQPSESELIQLQNETQSLLDGMKNLEQLFEKARDLVTNTIDELINLVSNWEFT